MWLNWTKSDSQSLRLYIPVKRVKSESVLLLNLLSNIIEVFFNKQRKPIVGIQCDTMERTDVLLINKRMLTSCVHNISKLSTYLFTERGLSIRTHSTICQFTSMVRNPVIKLSLDVIAVIKCCTLIFPEIPLLSGTNLEKHLKLKYEALSNHYSTHSGNRGNAANVVFIGQHLLLVRHTLWPHMKFANASSDSSLRPSSWCWLTNLIFTCILLRIMCDINIMYENWRT